MRMRIRSYRTCLAGYIELVPHHYLQVLVSVVFIVSSVRCRIVLSRFLMLEGFSEKIEFFEVPIDVRLDLIDRTHSLVLFGNRFLNVGLHSGLLFFVDISEQILQVLR